MKKYYKYILLLIYFFISLIFIFTLSRGDTFVNYGFSYAISKGEIPYNDFNMVITPLAPILYSVGLIFFNNIITIYLEQAILLTILFYCLNKLIDKKSILMLLSITIPFPIAFVSIIYPGYNYLLLLLMFIFIYYFKHSKNNYILGIILGLIFCTKQTIGLVLFIPTIYYLFKDRIKFLKIFIGYLIPIFILFIYLIITNSLDNFINLCFLGLIDFNNSNNSIDKFYLILFILGIIYIIYRIIKDKNNILLYYKLLFGVVVLPIIDYYHVSLFLILVIYSIIEDIKFNDKYYKYVVWFILSINIIWGYVSYNYFNIFNITNYNHFYLVINNKKYNDNSKELLKYTGQLDKRVIYFMRGSENYFYKIINNKKIDYFDLPNYGNYGYNGINTMKNKIDSLNNVYFVLDRQLIKNHDTNQQYIKELGQYVIANSIKKKSIGIYDIYYKK